MILSTVDGCPNGTRANNWEWSTLRTWLDNCFVPNAFNHDEQRLKNKAFILSYKNTVNAMYGFNLNPMETDPLRIASVTDFAIARGVKPSRSTIDKKTLVGWWWLRSPANYKMYYAYTRHKYDGGMVLEKDIANAKEAAQCRVCDVMHDGHVCTRGSIVDGTFITSAEESCDGTANGVRVAIEVFNDLFL